MIDLVATLDLGVLFEVGVVAAMRHHQSGCVIGISTLALPSCAVSPTIPSLYYEFVFLP